MRTSQLEKKVFPLIPSERVWGMGGVLNYNKRAPFVGLEIIVKTKLVSGVFRQLTAGKQIQTAYRSSFSTEGPSLATPATRTLRWWNMGMSEQSVQ